VIKPAIYQLRNALLTCQQRHPGVDISGLMPFPGGTGNLDVVVELVVNPFHGTEATGALHPDESLWPSSPPPPPPPPLPEALPESPPERPPETLQLARVLLPGRQRPSRHTWLGDRRSLQGAIGSLFWSSTPQDGDGRSRGDGAEAGGPHLVRALSSPDTWRAAASAAFRPTAMPRNAPAGIVVRGLRFIIKR
jgi:hypothetical protein